MFAIEGSVAPADVQALCERLRGLLDGGGAEVAVCDVGALSDADVVAIQALARLQLTARRLGCRVELRGASPELRALLAFLGLADVLGVEPGRQPEEREHTLGVEEERELDDPAV
jgi:anti-anti-sigma regulatory factor